MRALGVILILLVARVSAAEHWEPPSEWAVDPPAGWREDTSARGKMVADVRNLELTDYAASQSWTDGGAGVLNLVWIVMHSSNTTGMVDAFDRGFVRSSARSLGKDVQISELPRRTEGTMVIREGTADVGSRRTRLVRRYQAARDGLHVLILMCTARVESQCAASLDHATFTVANPIELKVSHSWGERAAEGAGFVVGILGVIWLVRRFSRRLGPRLRERLERRFGRAG